MSAGCKNRFITLLHRVEGRDESMAAKVDKFEVYASVYAERRQLSGTESSGGGKRELVSSQTVEFTCWYRDDVRRTDRVLLDGTAYDVFDIQEIGYRQETKLLTTASRPV